MKAIIPLKFRFAQTKLLRRLKNGSTENYVHIRFTDTKGGTELGFALDPESTDIGQADFDKGSGSVRLVGRLTLDYVKVRCIANIELETLSGRGHLEAI